MSAQTNVAEKLAPAARPPRFSSAKFGELWGRAKKEGRLELLSWARALGLRSLTTLYDWRNGRSEPRASQFYVLCDLFEVEPAALLE